MSEIKGSAEKGGIAAAATAAGQGLASGSRIQCRRGELLVDDLDEGEEVLTASGRWARILSIARRTLPVSIRVERDAFGPGQPYRAMSIGADQIIAVDGRLAEARTFVNQTTVRPELPGGCQFFRISLDKPGFAIVDGIAAELPHHDGPSPLTTSRPTRDRLRSLAVV